MATLQGKHILLGITGGIAAYKTPYLVRQLKAAGEDVRDVFDSARGLKDKLTYAPTGA